MALRVLVVEDEEDVAELLREMLRDLGHEPILARSVEGAQRTLTAEPVDVILLDLRLPCMGGLDFLRLTLPAARPPVIALSGAVTEEEAQECLRLGALDFLPKPVPVDVLRELLRYVEMRSVSARLDAAGCLIDRRRSARASAGIPVRIVEPSRPVCEGTCVELSAFGMKIQPRGPVATLGPAVRLVFAPPDGGPALDLLSVLVREDPDGYVFRFVNMTNAEFERLKGTVGQ